MQRTVHFKLINIQRNQCQYWSDKFAHCPMRRTTTHTLQIHTTTSCFCCQYEFYKSALHILTHADSTLWLSGRDTQAPTNSNQITVVTNGVQKQLTWQHTEETDHYAAAAAAYLVKQRSVGEQREADPIGRSHFAADERHLSCFQPVSCLYRTSVCSVKT